MPNDIAATQSPPTSELGSTIMDLLRTWPVHLDVREAPDGGGWFVWLEIDGAFPIEEAALAMASYWSAELDRQVAAVWTPNRRRTYLAHLDAPNPIGEVEAALMTEGEER